LFFIFSQIIKALINSPIIATIDNITTNSCTVRVVNILKPTVVAKDTITTSTDNDIIIVHPATLGSAVMKTQIRSVYLVHRRNNFG
jgi:hypothetical protein